MRPYIALFKSNMRLTLRDRAVLFFNYVFPLVFFFAFAGLFGDSKGSGVSYLVSMVLIMGILGNGLWGAGMRAVQEREANILRRFKVTPISPAPILTAAMAAGWLLYMPIVILVIGLAHFVYGMPVPRQWISLLLMVSLGVCSFRAIGLILAAVTNTMQEATVLIQLFYLPMLLLSGATVPAAMLPKWLQTFAEFMPASPLARGIQGILFQNRTILDYGPAVLSLTVTLALSMFVAMKLFRWEKEERIPTRNKLWVVAVLAPFLILGGWRAFTKEHLGANEAMYRNLQRSGSFLIRNARIFTAAGKTIENGAVLVRGGKIAEIYEGAAPDPDSLKADVVEGAGKTLLPGLIDVHVHLGFPGGVSMAAGDYEAAKAMPRAAAALLYSGVTMARSVGDGLEASLKLRAELASGGKLGAQLSVCGPMFTAGGGQGEELVEFAPAALREALKAQLVRTPKTPEEARRQVRALKTSGVDGLKAILEAGWGDNMLHDRFDLLLDRSVAEEAHAQNLPLATHTGDARDVADAVEIGSTSIEHGAWRDELPDTLLERMARQGVFYDPTLVVAEAYARYYRASADGLDNSLVQQAVSARVLKATRDFVASGQGADAAKAALFEQDLAQARANLLRVWQAGVPLAMGTDAGNPLVFHGPSLHRELQLWVQAGIPPRVALEAATSNAARLLRAANRTGSIRKGMDADLLLVDGNPLEDIAATERISLVVLKGERIRRGQLFDQK
jgi:imidazolonepropionase-like amidohydrolase/ABC-type multidrug transport system permease subunit